MFITQKHKSIVEQYFKNLPKYINRNRSKNQNYSENEYDTKMFGVIEKVMKIYEPDRDKSLFIKRYLIGQKPWQDACFYLHIERRTFYKWKDEILSDTVIGASINGLIDLTL